jgi:hypothetical protein
MGVGMMSYYGVIGGVIGGNTRRAAIRSIEKKLRGEGAVSVRTAVMPEVAKITSERELVRMHYLVKQGRVGRTKDGKVWWKD